MSSEEEGKLDNRKPDKPEKANQAKPNHRGDSGPKTVTFAEESHIWSEAGLDQVKSSPEGEVASDRQKKQENGSNLAPLKHEMKEVTESQVIVREVNDRPGNGVSQSAESLGLSPNQPTTEDRANMMDIGSRLPDVNIKEVTPFDRGSVHLIKPLVSQPQTAGPETRNEASRERTAGPADGVEIVTQPSESTKTKPLNAQVTAVSNTAGKQQLSNKQIVRFHIVAKIYPA